LTYLLLKMPFPNFFIGDAMSSFSQIWAADGTEGSLNYPLFQIDIRLSSIIIISFYDELQPSQYISVYYILIDNIRC